MIDFTLIRENFSHRGEFYLQLIDLFRADSLQKIDQIRQAVKEGNSQTGGDTAHALKGVAGVLGIVGIVKEADTLQRSAAQGPAAMAESLAILEREVRAFLAYVEHVEFAEFVSSLDEREKNPCLPYPFQNSDADPPARRRS